jgi:hypothetical protein
MVTLPPALILCEICCNDELTQDISKDAVIYTKFSAITFARDFATLMAPIYTPVNFRDIHTQTNPHASTTRISYVHKRRYAYITLRSRFVRILSQVLSVLIVFPFRYVRYASTESNLTTYPEASKTRTVSKFTHCSICVILAFSTVFW